MSTTEAEARAEAALRDYDYARISRVTVDPHRLAEALRALLAASRREPSEATTRKAIADAVRHHCTLTPNPMSGPYPLDATVQAVADWIENPPEWVRFPSESTALGASDGTSKSTANDLNREPSANVSNRPKDDISSGEMSVSEPSDTDEREWEYGVRDDAPTSYYGTIVPTADLDEANFGASVDDRMTPVRRRKAGPWEAIPDGA